MLFKQTKLSGAFVIEPERLVDERGFFARTWCQKEFNAHGLNTDLRQANIAFNERIGTLRGMHRQVAPWEEAKLVRCTRGAIYDVIIDLRPESPTYKQWVGVELTEINRHMLYVPEGFAHGYQTLSDDAEVFYLVSAFYQPGAERGIRWNDPEFGVEWPDAVVRHISEKDRNWPLFADGGTEGEAGYGLPGNSTGRAQ